MAKKSTTNSNVTRKLTSVTDMTSFENMSESGVFFKHVVDTDSATNQIEAARLIKAANPSDVIISRSNPGNHTLSLGGMSADEAIARLLSRRLDTTEALAAFARVLATPSYVSQAIEKLFKRIDVPMKLRSYQVSEDIVQETVAGILNGQHEEVQAAYSYVLSRVLEARNLLIISPAKQIVLSHSMFTATVDDIKTALLIDSIKGIFDEARIKATVAAISDEVTPRLMAEKLGAMFRGFSQAIPQIALELRYLDIAMFTVSEFLVSPETLPLELQANDAVIKLASYANIILAIARIRNFDASAMAESIETRRRAAEHVLKAIASTDMLETMPLSKFAEFFYMAPATAADGERRGVVLAKRYGQKSRMTLVDVYTEGGVTRMAEQDPALVRAAVVAPMIDQYLTSDEAVGAAVNLMADDLATRLADGTPFGKPELWTFQVTNDDLVYLAMQRASGLMITRAGNGADNQMHTFVYSVNVQAGWRMAVAAATGSDVFFYDPASVILYTSESVFKAGKALPAREQGVGTKPMQDTYYLGDMEDYLVKGISTAYRVSLPISGLKENLVLDIPVLSSFLMEFSEEGSALSDRSAYYAAIREIGVDSEVRNVLGVITSYLIGEDKIAADKAASWLISHLSPIMRLPVIVGLAEEVINTAFIAAKLDARRLASQMREIQIRALVAVVLVALNRFDKITSAQLNAMVTNLPVHTLSLHASLTMASLPSAFRR